MKTLFAIALALFCCKLFAQFDYKLVSNANSIILTNATIIDGKGNQPLPNQTIIIENGKIKDIFKMGTKPLPKIGKKIDLTNFYIIPGLIDAHYHFLTSVYSPTRQDSLLTYAFVGGAIQ